MKLINMKIDPKTREEKYAPTAVMPEAPMYPWGLSLTLDEEALEKLGITELPEVGKPLLLHARVDVTSVSANQNMGHGMGHGEKPHEHRSVGLQITDLALEAPAEKSDKPAQDVLYKKD